MPTRHPRVQVTIDRELADQVDAVRDQIRARGEAGVIRELALRGAQATLAGTAAPVRRSAQWIPVEDVAAALGVVPSTPDLMDDIRSLPGELVDPFE
jgi:hypothetical protein